MHPLCHCSRLFWDIFSWLIPACKWRKMDPFLTVVVFAHHTFPHWHFWLKLFSFLYPSTSRSGRGLKNNCMSTLSLYMCHYSTRFLKKDEKTSMVFKSHWLIALHLFLIDHGSYKWIIQLKWRFGTHGNWKNQNPGDRFGATS